ncbi:MAG: hypothetical protein EXR10_00940 [Alphaproteobacteria bacterium]|nr:hypothetical protein [Alphaproteobacteria bacterium]PHY01456.1 MAG: hypothetical protein CK529_00945 [Rhodospirillaceae bacterium]
MRAPKQHLDDGSNESVPPNDQAGPESAERDGRAFAVLALCFVGVTMAQTATDPAIAAKILNACESETQRLLMARL